MRLETNPKWPEWLKRDPKSGIWRVVQYRADKNPPRLDRSTGEAISIERAKSLGKTIYEEWLGHKLDGSRLRPLFSTLCDEVIEQMESAREANRKNPEQGIRQGTLDNAKLYIGAVLKEEFGHLHIDQITEGKAWAGFVARFQRECPGKTLYNHWKHMGMVMKHAYRSGHRERPWAIKNPDGKRKKGRILSEDEKAALLRVAPPNLRDEIIIAMTMGMRLREILKLEWARVDFERNTITLRDEDVKTKRGRVMAMSPQAREALELRAAGLFMGSDGYTRKRKLVAGRYVFPSRGNADMPTHQNKSAWTRAKRSAGILNRCRFHDLRHTFLTDCANLLRVGTPGISVVHVCAYAGLSIRTFERVYLQLDHNDTAAVSNLVTVKLRYSEKQQDLTNGDHK